MLKESAILVLIVCLVLPAGCENRSAAPPGDSKASPPPSAAPAGETRAAPAATGKQEAAAGTPAKAAPGTPSGAGTAPQASPTTTAAPVAPSSAPSSGATVRTPSGLEYEVLKEGEGSSPPIGSRVTVHFTGFVDGKKFRDTREGGVPKEFKLDTGNLIEGWVEALLTMKKGERRKIKVPSRLAYGRTGYAGVVPGERDVTFDLELVSFLPPTGAPGR